MALAQQQMGGIADAFDSLGSNNGCGTWLSKDTFIVPQPVLGVKGKIAL
jgi:hypothetical protein